VLRIGKHVGESQIKTRNNETLGYIVIEAGSGLLGSLEFEAAVGPSVVEGAVQSGAPYAYALTKSYTSAVLSSAAMQGTDGGWPLLYGTSPLTGTNLDVAYDEDQNNDLEREHLAEHVAFVAFMLILNSRANRSGNSGTIR
jgi:hypothetical protein